MDETKLQEIDARRKVATEPLAGRFMPGEIKFSLDDIPALIAEVRRLRIALKVLGNELNYVSTEVFGENGTRYPWDFAQDALKDGE